MSTLWTVFNRFLQTTKAIISVSIVFLISRTAHARRSPFSDVTARYVNDSSVTVIEMQIHKQEIFAVTQGVAQLLP